MAVAGERGVGGSVEWGSGSSRQQIVVDHTPRRLVAPGTSSYVLLVISQTQPQLLLPPTPMS